MLQHPYFPQSSVLEPFTFTDRHDTYEELSGYLPNEVAQLPSAILSVVSESTMCMPHMVGSGSGPSEYFAREQIATVAYSFSYLSANNC